MTDVKTSKKLIEVALPLEAIRCVSRLPGRPSEEGLIGSGCFCLPEPGQLSGYNNIPNTGAAR